ncbi:MAG TPA: hypothetical protein DCE41_17965 [Cytophagales bacterium]|nr:hypothetical protein [Cytophagales bacterium]HAA23640.1 hypothetical protein [Cytophagales bacterium]HAP65363.1 hypothetical protein [Cytophagales bacterium]
MKNLIKASLLALVLVSACATPDDITPARSASELGEAERFFQKNDKQSDMSPIELKQPEVTVEG